MLSGYGKGNFAELLAVFIDGKTTACLFIIGDILGVIGKGRVKTVGDDFLGEPLGDFLRALNLSIHDDSAIRNRIFRK